MIMPPERLEPVYKPITQAQITLYAEVSGDHNPIHLNPEFAARSQFGRIVAHGMLLLAFMSEMMTRSFGEAWLKSGKLKVRFRAPAYPGDAVTTEGILKPESLARGEAVYTVVLRNQNNQELITGEASVQWPAGKTL